MTIAHPITIAAAAKALRLRWHVVRRLALSGALRAKRVGGSWRVDADDLPRVRKLRPWSPQAIRRYAQNERLYNLGYATRRGQ